MQNLPLSVMLTVYETHTGAATPRATTTESSVREFCITWDISNWRRQPGRNSLTSESHYVTMERKRCSTLFHHDVFYMLMTCRRCLIDSKLMRLKSKLVLTYRLLSIVLYCGPLVRVCVCWTCIIGACLIVPV